MMPRTKPSRLSRKPKTNSWKPKNAGVRKKCAAITPTATNVTASMPSKKASHAGIISNPLSGTHFFIPRTTNCGSTNRKVLVPIAASTLLSQRAVSSAPTSPESRA